MGKLIVIEGLDASGKETQSNKLYERLINEGVNVKKVEFPDYNSDSSSMIKMYFSGDTEYNERLEDLKGYNIDIMFICINGKLGNMNVKEAIRLTERVAPRVGVPMHYGMFESNTEDPKNYTAYIPHGFEMELGRETSIKEILKHV